MVEREECPMDDIRAEIKGRIDGFKKMANLANKLEAEGDHEGALATRVALYDDVVDTDQFIETRIAELSSDDMTRTASMEKEAQWLKGLGKGVKKLGGGIWKALKSLFGKGGKIPGKAGEFVGRQMDKPGIGQRMLKPFVSQIEGARSAIPAGGRFVGRSGMPLTGGALSAAQQRAFQPATYGLSGLGKATAVGVPAGALGAAGLWGGRRGGIEGLGGIGFDQGSPGAATALAGYRRPPMTPGTAGRGRGGGTMALPQGGYNQWGRGGMGRGGGMQVAPMGGGGGAEMAQISGAVSSLAQRLSSLEGRVANLGG